MAASGEKAAKKAGGVIGAGSAALRKVIAAPLMRRKPEPEHAPLGFNSAAGDDRVNAVIEGDILPRLMLAFAAGRSSNSPDTVPDTYNTSDPADPVNLRNDIDRIDTQALADLPLTVDAANLLEEVERFLAAGVSVEDVYLNMLAPAARRLGEMWENDECDFVDVTMGLWRLQEVMRDIAARSPIINPPLTNPRSAVFAPIPGDVHSFGAQMIEDVFARAGWDSDVLVKPERRHLLDYVSHRSLDLVGLTVSRECPISALTSLIKAIRSVSANPRVRVLIGGHTINQNPGIVAEVGADGTGVDARAALDTAERLILAAQVPAHTTT